MGRRTAEQQIQDLEAKIQSIKERAERRKVRSNPAVKFMSMALRSIDKALNASDDAVLKKALDDARTTVASCLALTGVKPKTARKAFAPRGRGKANAELDAQQLFDYIERNPGRRSEEISGAFETDANGLRRVMQQLIDDGKVRTEGERRGRRYFAGK